MSRKSPPRQLSAVAGAFVCATLLAVLALTIPATALAALDPHQRAALETSGIVAADVIEALDQADTARILLNFEVTAPVNGKRLKSFDSPSSTKALEAAADAILRTVSDGRFELRHRYGAINALAGVADAEAVLVLAAAPGVTGISFDLPGRAHLTEAVPYTGANAVWDMGFDGTGVVVSVIDSGVDYRHRALKGAVKAQRKNSQCFCQTGGNCCPNNSSRQSGKKAAQDDNGHGTHVSGIVASRRKDGVDRGVAYGADILPIKVIAFNNSFCCYSDVLAAMDWIATSAPQVDVVNMSLGTDLRLKGHCDRKHPAGAATGTIARALRNRGVSVFASSGNDNDRKKMSLPACAKDVTSVAAQYDDDFLSADWNICADGPSIAAGDPVCFANTNNKTNLFAPGAPIRSARLGGGAVDSSGTSMASPMAAGCAALLRQASPGSSPAQILRALEKGDKVTDPKNRQKIPEVDCQRALAELIGN